MKDKETEKTISDLKQLEKLHGQACVFIALVITVLQSNFETKNSDFIKKYEDLRAGHEKQLSKIREKLVSIEGSSKGGQP